MEKIEDTEYTELLEQYIKKKEDEYGEGWAKAWGAIRNDATNIFQYVYIKYGREVAINKIKKYLEK